MNLNTQAILIGARTICFRACPDYRTTKSLNIGAWFVCREEGCDCGIGSGMAAYANHPRTDPYGTFWGCANALEYGVCCATEDNKYATGWAIPDSAQGMHGDYVGTLGARDAEDMMSWFNMRVRNALAFRSF